MVFTAKIYGITINKNQEAFFMKKVLSFFGRLEYNDGKCADGNDFSSDDEWRDLFQTLML